MRAGGRRVGLARALFVLTAVIGASLPSFSGTAAAAQEPKKERKRERSPEAVADATQPELKDSEPAPEPTDTDVPAAEEGHGRATTNDRVKARSGPGVDQPAVRTLDKDTPVDITCQTQGSPVEGSKTWYQLADGTYVAGAFISTPKGVDNSPECGAGEAAGNPAAVLASSTDEASSANPSKQASTKVNAAAAATESVLFVVDTSGSMSGPSLDQAKAALRQGISSLTDTQAAGLRHFPASSYCGPGQLLVPIATGNRPALQTAVDGLVAGGYTPTAAALRAAVADLPPRGTRTIVLISDGAANCDEDPCQTARDLVASGVKFTVQAVGFNVSGAAPAQLQCISDATGGRYFEATDGPGLAEAIKGAIPGQKEGFKYVALGDSYSSGEGVDPYFRDGHNLSTGIQTGRVDNRCHRSSRAYPNFVSLPSAKKSLYALASGDAHPGNGRGKNKYGSDLNVRSSNGISWVSLACAGATTANVLPAAKKGYPQSETGGYREAGTQLDHPSVNSKTDFITITIGGNDVRFSEVIKDCAQRFCYTEKRREELRQRIGDLKPSLVKTYRAIRKKAPNARILVLGYPHLLPESFKEQSCFGLSPFTGEHGFLRGLTVRLNRTISEAASEAGVDFVDVMDEFAGHGPCGSKGEWIKGISKQSKPGNGPGIKGKLRFDDESFRPNTNGQRLGYGEIVNQYLAKNLLTF